MTPSNSSRSVPEDVEDGWEPAYLKKTLDDFVEVEMFLHYHENMWFGIYIREIHDGEETDGWGIKRQGIRMYEIYFLR